ncbi:MAG: ORF6N domain-containing protein [Pseudomonadota bacterium]
MFCRAHRAADPHTARPPRAHLAVLYGVDTRTQNQAVRRNLDRFPEDFMFQLTWEEGAALRSQFVILIAPSHWLENRSKPSVPGDVASQQPRCYSLTHASARTLQDTQYIVAHHTLNAYSRFHGLR